jgi:phthiocerol/phenolphthiocerol synthesis type-I polyketide synthase D
MTASDANPIAIVGIGCRFPGGVETPAGLWRLAAQRRQTVGPVPAGRWDAERLVALQDPDEAVRYGRGCFLDGDVWAWDPEAFDVGPAEQACVDPQFRVLMEVAREAVEHAGIPVDGLRGSRTGVYVGAYAPDNLFREARPIEDALDSLYMFGNFTGTLVGRLAFGMDLRGPVMALNTMCSSGLVAVHTACVALAAGECEAALAGAVLLILSPEIHHYEASLLTSQRGACFAFDERADGYVRGEGAGMLLLKRLADAERDGDRVLAIIRGGAVNNDGQATRLTAPSSEMQQQLFHTAVERAGIDPGEVGLVEAHGAGTAVGDPVEYASINAVYGHGSGGCALGSIKTNIGHSEPASGIAGTIKAVECLRRGQIPPNLNFRAWNPAIQRDPDSRLFVPTELTPWPVDTGARLAAVCSYGVTGTSAHIVLEAPPSPRRSRSAVEHRDDARGEHSARLVLVSGSSPASLPRAATRLADWIDGDGADVPLVDVAHTLTVRRSHAEYRAAIVARDHAELSARARAFAADEEMPGVVSGGPVLPDEHAGPVFVFTGQGSQWVGMCQGLLDTEPVFAGAIDEIEPLMAAESGFSLREMLTRPERLRGVQRIQPVLFGIQVALARLWRSWGVEPAAVIGQSLGEVAAAVVAGALSLRDGVAVICRRATLLAETTGGAMASVLLDADHVRADIEDAGADGVSLGVLTSPEATVVSGDADQVAELVDRWESADAVVRLVEVDVASHSAQMDPILTRLGEVLADVRPRQPRARFYTTVRADPRHCGPLDSAYWVRNQRDTVRFHDAVAAAFADGHRLFIECAPHPLAVRAITATARHHRVGNVLAVGSLRRGIDDQDAFLGHVAALHCGGYDGIDWHSRYGAGELADVPGTAWNRVRHGGDAAPYRLVAPGLVGADQHPLLGGHVHDPERPERHLWQTPISPRRLPWLGDHCVAEVPVMPGTAFVEMALAAACRVFDSDRVRAAEVTVARPLVLEPEPTVTTRLVRDGDTARVDVLSHPETEPLVHASAVVRALPDDAAPARVDTDEFAASDWQESAPEDLYRRFRERHNIYHGPAFAGVERIRLHPAEYEGVSWLRLAETARVSASAMSLHPALTDELVQTVVALWLAYTPGSPGPVVVAGMDEVIVHGSTAHARLAHVRLQHADDLTCIASGQLMTMDGSVVAEVRGLRLSNILPASERYASRLAHLAWLPEQVNRIEPVVGNGTWTVIAPEAHRWAEDLAQVLHERSDGCRMVTDLPDNQVLTCASAGVVLIAGGASSSGADVASAAREQTARAVALIHRLSALPEPPRLWVVTRAAAAGEPAALATAGLRGLLRVAAYEHPELTPSSIDTTPDTPTDQIVNDLLDPELPMVELAWRDGVRHTARVRPGSGDDAPVSAVPASPLKPGASYLVTGGLGGLGLLAVRWLAERGAGRIVVVGRSAPSDRATGQLGALRDDGTEVVVVRGDIAEPTVAERAVDAATSDGRELRGILHTAGVVEDAILANLDDDLLARVWRGKAEGAWALHQLTADHALDFFVLYSSVASLLGSPGQAAYAAANAFLDALATHRAALGLPVTGIHWGPWSEVGRGQHLADRGFLTISPADGIDALERILHAGYQQVAYTPLDIAAWAAPYPALAGSTLLSEALGDNSGDHTTSPVLDSLRVEAGETARQEILESFIIDQVRDLLGGTSRHIAPTTSLVMLGIDSLGAVQLQQRIQRALNTEIKPGVIWVKPSPAGLADWLMQHMGFRPQAEQE